MRRVQAAVRHASERRYVQKSATLSITRCTVDGNRATSNGGAFFVIDADVTIGEGGYGAGRLCVWGGSVISLDWIGLWVVCVCVVLVYWHR